MNTRIANAKIWLLTHKVASIVIAVLVLITGYYTLKHFNNASGQTQYMLAQVRKTTVSASVTGSGQISTSNEVNIVPEVSGDTITAISVTEGDQVKTGAVIARIDSEAASRAVENAQLSLSNAQIAYDKASKNNTDQAVTSSVSDLNVAYEKGYSAVASTFIDLPDIISGTNDIFYTPSHSPYFTDTQITATAGTQALNYKYQAGVIFDQSKKDYDTNFNAYRAISPSEHSDKIVTLLSQTYATVKELSVALNSAYNTIDYINTRITSTPPAQIATDKSSLSTYITKVNADLGSIQSALTSIDDAKQSATQSELDLKSAQLAVNQAEDAYNNAVQDLANHTVRAPFDGTVAKIVAKVGDKASTGATISTLIANDKIAEISLNEIDAAKIKVGDKATLTFDAIDGLSMPGTVSQLDLLGTVSQGVVSYTIQIKLDQNDDRIRSGMTVNVVINYDSKDNVLAVPTSAIKTFGGKSFVQVLDNPVGSGRLVTSSSAPRMVPVTLGLSTDNLTEITSGLNEGDRYIANTIQAAKTAGGATPTATSLLGGGAARGAGGGNATFFRATGGSTGKGAGG